MVCAWCITNGVVWLEASYLNLSADTFTCATRWHCMRAAAGESLRNMATANMTFVRNEPRSNDFWHAADTLMGQNIEFRYCDFWPLSPESPTLASREAPSSIFQAHRKKKTRKKFKKKKGETSIDM